MDASSSVTNGGATPDLRCGPLDTHRDLSAASDLYRRVFGYDEAGLDLNTNLLTAVARNGGSVVGARTQDDALVGFAYGFCATDGEAVYHYSQAAVIDRGYQGRGVGRRLKLAQRDIALAWGQTHMRWAFNPLLTRNAHFNFDVLGGIGIGIEHDFYGRPGTDRIIVDWDLESAPTRHRSAVVTPPSYVQEAGVGELVEEPDSDAVWVVAGAGDEHVEPVFRAISAVFDRGLVLVGCSRIDDTRGVYLAEPQPTGRDV